MASWVATPALLHPRAKCNFHFSGNRFLWHPQFRDTAPHAVLDALVSGSRKICSEHACLHHCMRAFRGGGSFHSSDNTSQTRKSASHIPPVDVVTVSLKLHIPKILCMESRERDFCQSPIQSGQIQCRKNSMICFASSTHRQACALEGSW